MMENDRITFAFSEAKLSINAGQAGQFLQYYKMLVDWNSRINLTAITRPDEVLCKHFIDSCSFLRIRNIPADAVCADIGSGAGFPGIPLAILCPGASFTLIESLQKRAAFLDAVILELGLDNCETLIVRAEEAGHDPYFRGMFDLTTTRAVASFAAVCEYCLPLTKVGGLMVAYRGSDALETERIPSLLPLGAEYVCRRRNEIAGSGHSFFLAEKTGETDLKYPRRANAIKNNPIF